MQESPLEQLQKLAAANVEEAKKHYQAICDQRDTILAQAVRSAAKLLLEKSGYRSNPDLPLDQNNQQAVECIEEHLAQSSLSETDQALLALVGTGALLGWAFSLTHDEAASQTYRFYAIEAEELDPLIAHRVAKALDRCLDHEPVLRRFITSETAKLPQQEARLVTAAIHILLSEMTMSEFEADLGKVVLDGILGG